MKLLRILFLSFILAAFFMPQEAKAQAIVQEGVEWVWITDYGDLFFTTETHDVMTPSGNHLIVLYFYLPLDHPYVPEKGVNKFWIGDFEVFVNTDGVALIRLKENGSQKE
jgi:hypothetical protein